MKNYSTLRQYARQKRKSMTVCEKLLWNRIRHDQLGYRVLRQKVIGNYIVDFYIFEFKLIIEVDGESHNERLLSDSRRQKLLENLGYQMIRFWDYEIQDNIERVVEKIKGCFH